MNRYQIKNNSLFLSGGVGAIVAVCISVLLSLIYPILILNEFVSESSVKIAVLAVQLIASLFCAVISGILMKENKLLSMSISVGTYIILIICAALLFFEGISGNVYLGLIAILAGFVLAVFSVNGAKMRSRGRRRKRGNR